MSEGMFGLLGVMIGVLATSFQGWIASRWRRKRDARYLAARAICALDKYVDGCVEVVLDDGLRFGQRDSNGYLSPQAPFPEPISFAPDVDWRSIDHKMMFKLLSLTSEGEQANAAARFAWDIASPPDFDEYFEDVRVRFAEIGLKAGQLAEQLRDKFELPQSNAEDWDPLAKLREQKAKVEAIQSERAAHFRKHFEPQQ